MVELHLRELNTQKRTPKWHGQSLKAITLGFRNFYNFSLTTFQALIVGCRVTQLPCSRTIGLSSLAYFDELSGPQTLRFSLLCSLSALGLRS